MRAEDFHPRCRSLMALRPDDRHAGLRALHAETLAEYSGWLQAIPTARAHSASSDGRSIALVVGHIEAWDRFLIQACGEILSGVPWPSLMDLRGFLDEDGQRRDFASMDAFNERCADVQRRLPWDTLRASALDRAQAASALFDPSRLLTPERLEHTRLYEWETPGGLRIRAAVGWYVWMIIMEHEAVEHAADLARAAAA